MSADLAWIIVLGCGLSTFAWRALGVAVVRRIDPRGALFQWVSCVSYAMVAGLILRMIVLPESELVEVPLAVRLGAVAIAFAAYFGLGRRLLAGVVAGSLSLVAMTAWLG